MKIESFTNKGNRKVNEDYILSEEIDKDTVLCIVADGMGGYSKGDYASKLVANHILKYLKEFVGLVTAEVIKDAVTSANEILKDYRLAHNVKLGTTIGGTYISKNHAILFWVGDVRLYFFRDNKLLFESQDHSLINDLKKSKSLPSDWDVDKIKHVVTRSVTGNGSDFYPDFFDIDMLKNRDTIIICSDGIHNTFSPSPESIINNLREYQYEDNASAIIIEKCI